MNYDDMQSNQRQMEHKSALPSQNNYLENKLYKAISSQNDNVIFSPWNMHLILLLLHKNGTNQTKAAMENIFTGTLQEPAAYFYDLMRLIGGVKTVQFLTETRIYVNNKVKIRTSLQERLIKDFMSHVQILNFKDVDSEDMTVSLEDSDSLIFISKLYFKAKWDCKFEQSEKKDFLFNESERREVPLMKVTHYFYYKVDEFLKAKVVEIPFASKKLSMILLVPQEKLAVTELEAKLSTITIDKIIKNMKFTFLSIWLPKFMIKKFVDFTESLKTLKLDKDFCTVQEFAENTQALPVDKIVQKIDFTVDEDGYPAPPRPYQGPTTQCFCKAVKAQVCADQPFIIFVKTNEETPKILLRAKVTNPSQ